MADNPLVNTNTAAAGATNVPVAGDDIGGAIHQRVKVEFGTDGTATEVSTANPLPVVQTGAAVLPTGAATEATSAAILAKIIAAPATETTLVAIDGKTPALVSGRVPVDGSGVTQPVSASSLPLPAGAATDAGIAAIISVLGSPAQAGATQAISAASLPLPAGASTEATLSALNGKIPAQGQAAMAASQPVAIASNQSPIPISAASLPLPSDAATQTTSAAILAKLIAAPATEATLVALEVKVPSLVDGNQPIVMQGNPVVGFYPGVLPTTQVATAGVLVDEFGALYTRGGVTTDEASFRINASGSAISRALPGTLTWTNGSASITGTGLLAMVSPLLFGDYVKRDSDTETHWAQVFGVTDTEITLRTNYTGTSGVAVGSVASYKPVTGTGGSITVGSGILNVIAGTTNSANTNISRRVDYGPLAVSMGLSLTARNSNQDIYAGLDAIGIDSRYYARFHFSGTTNTVVLCETGWALAAPAAGTDQQSTTVTLPNGLTSATSADYRIEQDSRAVYFYINDVMVATHRAVLPRPYDVMSLYLATVNGTGASTTTLAISYVSCNNFDSLRVAPANQSDNFQLQNVAQQDFPYNVAGVIAINTDLLIIDCAQLRHVTIQCIAMGTSGVVTPAFSNDGGTTWDIATMATLPGVLATTFNAAGRWNLPVAGRLLRLRLTTATTAGTTTIRVAGDQQARGPVVLAVSAGTLTTVSTVTTVSTLSNTTQLTPGVAAANLGKAEDAVAASGDTGVAVWGVRRDALTTSTSAAGDYGEMATNRFGAQCVADFRTTARTFRASANVAAAAAATDVFDIFGNATTTVIITRVFISAIQTTAGSADILLLRRSTANSGGTRAAMTAVPLDATDSAANSVPGTYTVNPTPGTLVGAVGRRYLGISGAAALTGAGIEWRFGENGKGISLSGTAQGLTINLNGVTLAGGTVNIEVEWIEF